jgi:hypothetical protein
MVVAGAYVRRGEEPGVREEAESARDHYATRVSAAVQEAGTSISEMSDQLGDWRRRQPGGGGSGERLGVQP